jgi:hypothetical protein
MIMEHWWNCCSVHHKSHTDWALAMEAGDLKILLLKISCEDVYFIAALLTYLVEVLLNMDERSSCFVRVVQKGNFVCTHSDKFNRRSLVTGRRICYSGQDSIDLVT